MDNYAVFGNPIEHSLSPTIHTQFAQQTGCDIRYTKILAAKDEFTDCALDFISSGGKGFNITVPFKVEAFKIANHLTLNAKTAGAVNTIKIQDGELYGENTDGKGLVNDLCNNLGLSLEGKDILILGAGGATQGILLPLLEQKPVRILVANRTKAKSEKLAMDFATHGKVCGFGMDQIKAKPVDIVINATSASLSGEMPAILPGVAKGAFCYDLMYGQKTPFMNWAKQSGASGVSDGLGMLVEQAAEAYYFWRGVMPKTDEVLASLRATIG